MPDSNTSSPPEERIDINTEIAEMADRLTRLPSARGITQWETPDNNESDLSLHERFITLTSSEDNPINRIVQERREELRLRARSLSNELSDGFARNIRVSNGEPEPISEQPQRLFSLNESHITTVEAPVIGETWQPFTVLPDEEHDEFVLEPESSTSNLQEKIEIRHPNNERINGICAFCEYEGRLIVTGHSGNICNDCYQEHIVDCSYCSRFFPVGDFVRHTNIILCYDCLHSNYYRCNYHEGETWFLLSLRKRTDDGNICKDCIERVGFVFCDNCSILHLSNVTNLCHRCEQERDPGYIQVHSFVPNFQYFGEDNLRFGVELEMEPDTSYSIDFLVDQGKNIIREEALLEGKPFIYLKYDGSLGPGGLELVSHPASLEIHTSKFHWGKLLARMKENHFLADETNTCGLHVHMSKNHFTRNDLIKIGVTVFKHQQLFEMLGRRNSTNYCHFGRIEGYDKNDSKLLENIERAIHSDDRYEAVNFTNQHTIELRFFKGTMLNENLMFSLEISNLIASLVKETNIRELRKADSFQYVVNYLLQNASKPTQNLIKKLTKGVL